MANLLQEMAGGSLDNSQFRCMRPAFVVRNKNGCGFFFFSNPDMIWFHDCLKSCFIFIIIIIAFFLMV